MIGISSISYYLHFSSKSTEELWSQFFQSVQQSNDLRSYGTMRELCKRDANISYSEKHTRWENCSGDVREICTRLNNCKSISENAPACNSGSAINDKSLFFLWINCEMVINGDDDTVGFGRPKKYGLVDYSGIAHKINKQ